MRIWNAAVQKVYGGQRRISWMEIYAGEKAAGIFGGDYFPAESLEAIREFQVGIKGPLTTPVGGGFRSLNVALRKDLDLYACVRPVQVVSRRAQPAAPPRAGGCGRSSARTPRTSTPGVEYKAGSPEAQKVERFLKEEMGAKFWPNSGIGIKPISEFGSKRLIRKAFEYAVEQAQAQRDPRPQGQHPEVHRGRVHAVGLRAGARGVRRRHHHRAAAVG